MIGRNRSAATALVDHVVDQTALKVLAVVKSVVEGRSEGVERFAPLPMMWLAL